MLYQRIHSALSGRDLFWSYLIGLFPPFLADPCKVGVAGAELICTVSIFLEYDEYTVLYCIYY
jgi:hypothetical protein